MSNRGFPSGYLGDVERRDIDVRPTPDGATERPPVLISGGVRRWEASLELRIPITPSLGFVVFADAGDVTRRLEWRFNHPQIAVGGGLRLKIEGIGTVRFDVAGRLEELQVFGTSTLIEPCQNDLQSQCRPITRAFDWFGPGSGFPGALHLTFGEAF